MHEEFGEHIWEPACGDGAISKVLEEHGHIVHSTDLYDRGYGEAGHNFMLTYPPRDFDALITNPPFNLAEPFIKWATMHGIPKVAFFVRLAFLEGKTRLHEIWRPIGLSRIYVFSDRVTLYPNGVQGDRDPTGFMSYAWYIWDVEHEGPPNLFWIELSAAG